MGLLRIVVDEDGGGYDPEDPGFRGPIAKFCEKQLAAELEEEEPRWNPVAKFAEKHLE